MKKILITVRNWEKRVAITQGSLLQNIYFDSHVSQALEKSFFKGYIAKVLPGVQTAFVDIGQERAGFLHISEIDRDLAFKRFHNTDDDEIEEEIVETQRPLNQRTADISKILTQGEHLLVQVSKEPINEKGAKLTTCFTLPGRFVVLMPNIPKIGISKKIYDPLERKRLKEIVISQLPETAGCIIRTTCENKQESEIVQDIQYLLHTWQEIQKRYEEAEPQQCIHQDIELSLQVVRDHLDGSVESIICDNEKVHSSVYNFVKSIAPEFAHRVFLHNQSLPLFEAYKIEEQIQQALQPKVELASGGSIVIDSTEAMTVIDVNTGRYVGATKLEETLLKTNMEAAAEIVRQLKLRNYGGLIVIDFIDMTSPANRHKLFTYFEQTLKDQDRSQSVVLKISEFGLVQMTRKRTGKTLHAQLTETCASCGGIGVVKSIHSRVCEFLRALEKFLNSKQHVTFQECLAVTSPAICHYLLDIEFDALLELEKNYRTKIIVRGDAELHRPYHFEVLQKG